MPKLQQYEIVFNEPYTDKYDAMSSVGLAAADAAIRNITMTNILIGNITNEESELTLDGLTLRVSRLWSDSAYNELIQIASPEEIKVIIEDLAHVSSVTYGFSDA